MTKMDNDNKRSLKAMTILRLVVSKCRNTIYNGAMQLLGVIDLINKTV